MKKKKSASGIIIVLLLLVMAGLAGFGFLTIKRYASEEINLKAIISQHESYISENSKYIYVATTDIHRGDILVEGLNVEQQSSLTALPEYMYIDDSYLGYTAVIDIQEGSPIFAGMICEETVTNDMRQMEIAYARLMQNLMPNDYVDVRIRFANGADYIVASKLRVRSSDVENMVFYTDVNESEIMTLSCAAIDAYVNSGTLIYLTKYEEPSLQTKAEVTYPVSDIVYDLMLTNPNIMNLAVSELNRQNREYLASTLMITNEKWLEAVTNGEGLADSASNASLMAEYAKQKLAEEEPEVAEW